MARKKMTAAEKNRRRRMRWWHQAKFGMFVHWGLYSVLGRHEWAMECEGIPVAEYERLAKRFNPKPMAARAWARLARQAGMKYMVMTTKHHEGFCLFDTQHTDYCAPKQACGRDLVAEYVKAARAEGLRVGFYHSLMDWHHPDGARCMTDQAARKRFIKYIHGQVRELCTNYGRLDIMWYDVAWPLDAAGWQSRKMNSMVRRLQPDIIINNRSKLPEDFGTPEQRIVPEKGRAWEVCMTMNDSWGYHRNDDNWKSPKQVIRDLVTCAHGGGNYLLNIGPRPDGSIPAESVRILTEVGQWMKRNGRTIYGADTAALGTEPSYVGRCLFGNFTQKGKTLYLHVHFWPGRSCGLMGLRTRVKSAKILKTGKRLRIEQDRFRVQLLDMPARAPDDPVTVIVLECASKPKQDPMWVRCNKKREGV